MAQDEFTDIQPIKKAQQPANGQAQDEFTDIQPIQKTAPSTPAKPAVEGVRPPISKEEDKTDPYKKGPLEFAEDYYQRGTGAASALGRLATTPFSMARAGYHALTDEPTNPEEQAIDVSGPTPGSGRLGLAAKRLLYDPQAAEAEKAKDEAEKGHTSESMGHSVAAGVPLVGPYAASLGERAGTGDVSGALTEGAGMFLLPKVAKEAMPGGALPGAAPEGARPFPVGDSVVRGASKVASKVLTSHAAPTIAATAAGIPHPFVAAQAYRSFVPDAIGESLEKGKVHGLTPEEASHQQLEERAVKSEKEAAKTKAEIDRYKASKEQGVEPPEDVVKRNEKAQTKAAEDRFHADAAREAAEASKPVKAAKETPITTDHMQGFQRDIDSLAPRVKPAEAPAPSAPKPINVKGPGEVQPERVGSPDGSVPNINEGETLRLPNNQGVRVGKPKLLSDVNPEPPKQEVLPPEEKPVKVGKPERGNVRALTVDEKGNVIDKEETPEGRVESLLREGLKSEEPKPATNKMSEAGPKNTDRFPSMSERLNSFKNKKTGVIRTEAAPEAKVTEKDNVHKTREELGPGIGPDGRPENAPLIAPDPEDLKRHNERLEKLKQKEVKTPERSAESANVEPKVHEQVANLSDENLKKLAKAHGLDPESYDFKARDEGRHRVDRDQLAKDITAKMGDDEVQNIARNAENNEKLFSDRERTGAYKAANAEKLFPRLRGPVDEFGNPSVSGGSQGATLEAHHWSNVPDIKETDPEKMGTGIRGAERERMSEPGFVKRTNFGTEGYKEPAVQGQKYHYVADLDKTKYYDPQEDAEGLWKKGFSEGGATGAEKAVRDAGYHGYRVGNEVASFEKVPVRPAEKATGYSQKADKRYPATNDVEAEKLKEHIDKTSAQDTDHVAKAKAELGDNAYPSDILRRAQELKDAAKKTSEAEPLKPTPKAPNSSGEEMTHTNRLEGGNKVQEVVTRNEDGKKIGEILARETKPGELTVRSNQIYDQSMQGKGRGTEQLRHLLSNTLEDVNTVKSDISTSDAARGVWDKLMKQFPDAISKQSFKDGQVQYTIDMNKYREPIDVAKGADNYNSEAKLPKIEPEKVGKYERAADVADDYQKMKHDPNDPSVKKSYKSLVDDVKKQWDYATKKMGINIVPTDTDPYSSYEQMKDDVNKNKQMKVWRGGNPLPEDHPLAQVDSKTGENLNTMFRAVHDIFGHVAQDHDFSEPGEESAWNVHRQMMNPDAVPAMTTETRGQTSWFFNNEGVRGGEPLGKFAEQKAGLLPEYANERTSEAGDTTDKRAGQERRTEDGTSPTGEERRQAERRATLRQPTELSAALDRGENVKTPFDVTEGANETIKRDQAMPKHESESLEKPKASMQTARMSDAELLKAGFTRDQIRNGEHLPTVSGGSTGDHEVSVKRSKGFSEINGGDSGVYDVKVGPIETQMFRSPDDGNWYEANTGEHFSKSYLGYNKADALETLGRRADNMPKVNGKGSPVDEFGNPTVSGGSQSAGAAPAKVGKLPKLAEENLRPEEKAGVTKSQAGRDSFVDNLMKMPSVKETTDIAKAGEGGKEWYQRSTKAFDHLMDEAPRYFTEADRKPFLDFTAALSPQQSVAMNLREALHTWTQYVDEGRPTGKALEKLLKDNVTLPGAKVPNAVKALSGQPLWPDLSKNTNFKVPSFGDNLSGNLDRVTNDGWMALFNGVGAKGMAKPTVYHAVSAVTRAAADALGWKPAEAQAAIWAFTKVFTEKGETDPKIIRQYSEDFADIMRHDPETRQLLQKQGVDLGKLDTKLAGIGKKPEITPGAGPTTENSVRKLASRIETARGKGVIPQPKSGLFGHLEEPDEDVEFNPEKLEEDSRVKTKKSSLGKATR